MFALLPRVVAALVSGTALALISPPVGLHWLHWFVFLPLFWALRPDQGAENAFLGWIAGFAGVSTLFFWLGESIVLFSNIPEFLSLQIVHIFALAFGLQYALVFGPARWLRAQIGGWWVLALPALQVATEFLMPALFPYYHGVSQYRVALTWQLASVTGVYGVSFLVFLTNCALAEALYRRQEGRPLPAAILGAAAAAWLANLGFGAWRVSTLGPEIDAWPRARLSQLQQEITMEARLAGTSRQAMMDWVKQSGEIYEESLDLMVWPEGATPYDPRHSRVLSLMANVAKNSRAPVLFGGGFAERKEDPETGRRYVEQRNSIYLLGEDKEIVARYDKMVPLPFGEYLPLADTFPVLKEIIEGPGDFEAGEVPIIFEAALAGEGAAGQRFRFSTPICYEAILSRFVREHLADVDLLVNVTNDGWFGDTAAPHQHAMLSAVRAMELGVPMYRLAYTGVSMVIDPLGRIADETAPYTKVSRVVEVPVGRAPTIYARIGDLFATLCTLGAAGALFIARRRDRRRALRRAGDVTPAVDPA